MSHLSYCCEYRSTTRLCARNPCFQNLFKKNPSESSRKALSMPDRGQFDLREPGSKLVFSPGLDYSWHLMSSNV